MTQLKAADPEPYPRAGKPQGRPRSETLSGNCNRGLHSKCFNLHCPCGRNVSECRARRCVIGLNRGCPWMLL